MSLLSIILLALLIITALRLIIIERKYCRLKLAHEHIQELVDSLPDLIWVKDRESRFLFVNSQFKKTFSLPKDHFIGKTDFDLPCDNELAQSYFEEDMRVQRERKIHHIEEQINKPDGSLGWSETLKVPLIDKNNNVVGTAGIARDITARKLAELKMVHIVYHDELTGLPNRNGFNQQFNKLLSLNNCTVAIILFNLNNFKNINDSLGHHSGDKTLIQIASRLKSLVNDNTIIARLSGDEFAIAHNYAKFENSLANLKVRLLELLIAPIILNEIKHRVTASFGVAVGPQDGRDVQKLLQHADLAMYQSKVSHSKGYVHFMPEFAEQLLYKMKLSNQLNQGIEKNQFHLTYQPKVDSTDKKLIGVEALLRWKLDDKLISPYDFIPIAEKNGFIVELGNWVITTALQQMRYWIDNNIECPPIAINISAIQLHQPEFADTLIKHLHNYQIPGIWCK